jgi:predicted nuclease of predicted toxin-antitoxin system
LKFKLDENVPRRAGDLFADAGHDVSTVKDEGLVGEPDEIVARTAAAEGRMLVTLDKDLGDLRSFPPGTHPGIIVMRLGDQSAPRVTTVLGNLLEGFDLADLVGCLVVVEDARVRVRRP